MSDILVTGGAGFIGSHLVERLRTNNNVTILDNVSSGNWNNIENRSNLHIMKYDIGQLKGLEKAVEGQDIIFHLAANPDIQKGIENTDLDLKQETINTYRVLEIMRRKDVDKIVFTSTSAIYGDHHGNPLKENTGPLLPTSLYGAGKLASEGLISAYCDTFGFKAWIFRFANIIGPRATHGVIVDFIDKLNANRDKLVVLGNGEQEKPYMYIDDCIDGMIFGFTPTNENVNVYNLSTEGTVKVKEIAELVRDKINSKAAIIYQNKEKGIKRLQKISINRYHLTNKLGIKIGINKYQISSTIYFLYIFSKIEKVYILPSIIIL